MRKLPVFEDSYNRNPKACKHCGKLLSYAKRRSTFCCMSCSASFNNRGKVRHGIPAALKQCLYCGKPRKGDKFCNYVCQREYHYLIYINKWKLGLVSGVVHQGVSDHIRHYLYKKYNGRCKVCGWAKVNPVTGKIPLHVEHINGDWRDNTESNLELLCPNCHSLTPTYGVLNKGNGRRLNRAVV